VDASKAPVSLYDILVAAQGSSCSFPLPTLSQRFHIAQKLAISVLELQNARWLHKDINSKNVLFFHDSSGTLNFEKPYIAGFEFARAESFKAISAERDKEEFTFYWHPALRPDLGDKGTRPQYLAGFDVYSLGLVLLDIALWRATPSFYTNALADPRKFTMHLIGLTRREVPHRRRTGKSY
jgi:hypothetical protein